MVVQKEVDVNCTHPAVATLWSGKWEALYLKVALMYNGISGKLIVSRYIAESITTDAGCFGHIDHCQLRTKLKILQCETG